MEICESALKELKYFGHFFKTDLVIMGIFFAVMLSRSYSPMLLSHTPSSINRWLVCCINTVHKPQKTTEDILFYRCKQLVNKVSLSMQYCNAILTCWFCLFFPVLPLLYIKLVLRTDCTQSFVPSGWAVKHLFYRAPNNRLHFKSDAVSLG